jgi:hypothetical protein
MSLDFEVKLDINPMNLIGFAITKKFAASKPTQLQLAAYCFSFQQGLEAERKRIQESRITY